MDVSTIQKRIDLLEKYEEEVRNAKEMLDGELDNSVEYLEAVEEAKAVTQKKKQIKDEVLGSGPNQKLLADIKANTEEIATLKEILSVELMQIFQENKTDEFHDANGEPRKFKVSVKLLPKKGVYQNRNTFGQYEKDAD
ncbi:MAG: hypothetical protein WC536_04380 [Patescibacteria group bacterium]|jgi:hypothetical protein